MLKAMFDYTHFQQVFPAGTHSPYDMKLQGDIEDSRREHGGSLFIDRVLKALGITKAKMYPPKTENALRQFHQQICEAPMSMQHKLSLFYYVLLDFQSSKSQAAPAELFADASGLSRDYQLFMKGLWYLDRLEFPTAVEFLGHPSLMPDFANDIVIALVRHSPKQDYSLALTYFYTVQPTLNSDAALECLFDAIAYTSLSEALLFSRLHPDHVREQLFHRLIAAAMNAKASKERTSELASLALQPTEEAWLEEYLTVGDGKNLKRGKDTLLIRKIAADQFEDVSRIRNPGQWATVVQGIRGGIRGTLD